MDLFRPSAHTTASISLGFDCTIMATQKNPLPSHLESGRNQLRPMRDPLGERALNSGRGGSRQPSG